MAASVGTILAACTVGWWYFYGSCILFFDVLMSSLPMPIVGSVMLTILVYILRLPQPPAALIDEVLGKDLEVEADEDENVENSRDFNYRMRVVAHRACGFDAPENSMSAVRLVQDRKCTAVEIDASLTADGIAVLYHDKTLERMCDMPGRVDSLTYDELQQIDISVTHPLSHKFPNERIPRLDDAVEEAMSLGLRIFIDLKDNDTRIITALLELFGKYPELVRRAVVTSFYPHIIYMVRRALPDVVCAVAWRPGVIAYEDYTYSRSVGGPYRRRYDAFYKHWLACIGDYVLEWVFHNLLYFLLGLPAVLVHKDSLAQDRVRHWRKKGVRAIAWPVNLPAEKEFFGKILQVTYLTDTLDGEPE